MSAQARRDLGQGERARRREAELNRRESQVRREEADGQTPRTSRRRPPARRSPPRARRPRGRDHELGDAVRVAARPGRAAREAARPDRGVDLRPAAELDEREAEIESRWARSRPTPSCASQARAAREVVGELELRLGKKESDLAEYVGQLQTQMDQRSPTGGRSSSASPVRRAPRLVKTWQTRVPFPGSLHSFYLGEVGI
jgi:hypothetical protein